MRFKKTFAARSSSFLDISQRTYSNFESDKSEPSLIQLSKLAEILEFNLLKMLQEQGIVFQQSYNEFKDNSSGIVLHNNNESSKLIAQLEVSIKNLQEINQLLKDKIASLENK